MPWYIVGEENVGLVAFLGFSLGMLSLITGGVVSSLAGLLAICLLICSFLSDKYWSKMDEAILGLETIDEIS